MIAFARYTLIILAITCAELPDAFGQAWVGNERSLSAALNYEFSRSNSIVEASDIKIGGEVIVSHAIVIGAEFVPIEKLAVSAQLPLLMTKYQGNGMLFPRHGRYDDGDLHATLQDFRLATRYQLLAEPLALAPHVAVTIPTSDYETLGYANAGRGLKQLHFGLALGRFIGERLYAHLSYEFTWSERYDATPNTETVGQNRSDLAVTVGYLLLDGKLEINLAGNYRLPHGGIDFVDFNTFPMDLQDNHDPLLKEKLLLLGGGIAYNITEKIQATLTGRVFVTGENTRNANSIGVGVSWDVM
jgi:hypothetical protein